MRSHSLAATLLALTLSFILARSAQATPPQPFSPYGTVQEDGADVADGTVVSAWCGGIMYREITTQMQMVDGVTHSWYFNLDIPGDDPDTPAKDGCSANETVTFMIGPSAGSGLAAGQTAPWMSSSPRLDLTVTSTPAISKTRSFRQGVLPDPGYAGAADAHLSAQQPGVNFGSATTVVVSGSNTTSKEQWALLKWDLSSTFGWVQSVSLIVSILDHSGGQAYQLYEALAGWSENGVTWANKPATGAAVLGRLAPSANGNLTVSLNAAGVAVVQKWLTTPSTNFGFYLRNTPNSNDMTFYSRDYLTSSPGSGLTMRPRLTVTFVPPVLTLGPTVSNITAASARVQWESDTYARGRVRYRGQGTSTWTTRSAATVLTSGKWQATVTLSGLSANTTYEYQARASLDSPWTIASTFRTATTAAAPGQ